MTTSHPSKNKPSPRKDEIMKYEFTHASGKPVSASDLKAALDLTVHRDKPNGAPRLMDHVTIRNIGSKTR